LSSPRVAAVTNIKPKKSTWAGYVLLEHDNIAYQDAYELSLDTVTAGSDGKYSATGRHHMFGQVDTVAASFTPSTGGKWEVEIKDTDTTYLLVWDPAVGSLEGKETSASAGRGAATLMAMEGEAHPLALLGLGGAVSWRGYVEVKQGEETYDDAYAITLQSMSVKPNTGWQAFEATGTHTTFGMNDTLVATFSRKADEASEAIGSKWDVEIKDSDATYLTVWDPTTGALEGHLKAYKPPVEGTAERTATIVAQEMLAGQGRTHPLGLYRSKLRGYMQIAHGGEPFDDAYFLEIDGVRAAHISPGVEGFIGKGYHRTFGQTDTVALVFTPGKEGVKGEGWGSGEG